MAKTSAIDKEKVISIIQRLDKHIPISGYVNEVENKLSEKEIICKTTGKAYSENQIRFTRQLRAYHLPVAQAFQELYDPSYIIQSDTKKKTLLERQKLNKP